MPTARKDAPGNLPLELPNFVGRQQEVKEIKGVLAASRLVTLTGVGGVGKTRLALRVAAEVRRAFRDGAWFVDLTQLRDPDLLAQEVQDPDTVAHLIMAALGVRQSAGSPVRQLTEYLAGRQTLVVLDNCEHLLPACALMIDAPLRDCPRLRVLATSREPLALRGEVLYPVVPLPVPEPGQRPTVAALPRYDSVTLFLDRARAAVPGFALTDTTAAAVAELCRRLDGVPLAIELAAAWIRTLEPRQILDRLADRFTLLSRGSRDAPARQQALRACVEWSFNLCSKPERLLWARSSVFVGGFELDALEGVCADDWLPADDLVDVLAGLIDKSIVDRTDSGGGHARYRMLETIRDYGQEQLVEAGEQQLLRRRHRDWYERLAARAMAERISPRQTYWIARFAREHPNMRAAVELCLAEPDQAATALRILTGLPWLYWSSRGLCSEGLGWLERALAQTTAPTVLRVRALLLTSFLAAWIGDADRTMPRLDESRRLAERLHDPVGLARAAFIRGTAAQLLRNDLGSTAESAGEGLAILSALPEREQRPELNLRLQLLIQLGQAAALTGEHDRARRCFQEALEIAEATGASVYRIWAAWGLGLVAWRRGESSAADHQMRECLRFARQEEMPDPYVAALSVESLAWIAAERQQHRRAAVLLGVVDGVQTGLGRPVNTSQVLIADHDECARRARTGLGDTEFADAVRHGQALPLDDAIAYAVGEPPRTAPPPPSDSATLLTHREREVADLVAQGLTNKEIADRLVISQRTAESHIEHIRVKLGFTNRTEIAVWTQRQNPPTTPD